MRVDRFGTGAVLVFCSWRGGIRSQAFSNKRDLVYVVPLGEGAAGLPPLPPKFQLVRGAKGERHCQNVDLECLNPPIVKAGLYLLGQ